jgi:hypothetical protein
MILSQYHIFELDTINIYSVVWSLYVKEHTVKKPVLPVTRLPDGVWVYFGHFLASYSVLATLLMPPILYF